MIFKIYLHREGERASICWFFTPQMANIQARTGLGWAEERSFIWMWKSKYLGYPLLIYQAH